MLSWIAEGDGGVDADEAKRFAAAGRSRGVNAPRLYLVAAGGAVVLLAVVGFALVATDRANALGAYLLMDQPHNVVHVALALVALGLAAAPLGPMGWKRSALGLGIVYLAVAVLGFVRGDLWDVPERFGWRMHLDLGENLLHLILGGWGAYVGSQDET